MSMTATGGEAAIDGEAKERSLCVKRKQTDFNRLSTATTSATTQAHR